MDIKLKNIKTHNLKGIDLCFKKGMLNVVTGVSGSGKSSVVFDTLYAESYRRYLESLSSYARQYLKAMPKPEVESVENLPAAIAVQQARSGATSRSTVGSLTELNDLFRIVFSHMATLFCPSCQKEIVSYTPDKIATELSQSYRGQSLIIAASLSGFSKLSGKKLSEYLLSQGFSRILSGKDVVRIEEAKVSQLKSSQIIVDKVSAEDKERLREAANIAYKIGDRKLVVFDGKKSHEYSGDLVCRKCDISFLPLSETLFSHNHPLGACATCQGFGFESVADWEKVFPDQEKSVSEEGVKAFNFGQAYRLYDAAKKSAKSLRFDCDLPFKKYSQKQWEWIKYGDGKTFSGVTGFFLFLESKRHKPAFRIHHARFRKYVPCSTCDSKRLNESALSYLINGKHFSDYLSMNLTDLRVEAKKLIGNDAIAEEALSEILKRCDYLSQVGLSYLNLSRLSRTLSGGELQRILMARCLGSALTETLYCLDEPTAGLHPRDTIKLVSVLESLRDQGNTLVVVEHEKGVIDAADTVTEIGPLAGHKGGYLVERSDQVELGFNQKPKKVTKKIRLEGVQTNNLKNITLDIPIQCLVGVCGVSGSGKTSLIQHTLYPSLCKKLAQSPEGHVEKPILKKISGDISSLSQVVHVGQAQIGRSSRSNVATYLGIFTQIRHEFAATPLAKKKKLKPGAFSFNSSGGRCESCRGLGTIVEELSFLGEMKITCPECEGRRFSDDVLEVKLNGKTLIDFLSMSVSEVKELLIDYPSIFRILEKVEDIGLGYLRLGHDTSRFSGGEAQRLKLLKLLIKSGKLQPSLLIFDEPTTGLSDSDVIVLARQLQGLVDNGHSVIVVEHHVGLLRACDHLIEVGPDAAYDGGEIVYCGLPQDLKKAKTHTSRFI